MEMETPKQTNETVNEESPSKLQMLSVRNRLLCGLTTGEDRTAVRFEDIEDQIRTTFGDGNPRESANMIGQFTDKILAYVEIDEQGPSHDVRFTIQGMLGVTPHQRVSATSKAKCKTGCAYFIWRNVLTDQVSTMKAKADRVNTSTEDRIAALSHLKYWQLVQESPQLMRGRKVLATFVLERKQRGRNNSIYEVVSLATGNRFIANGNLVCDGTVVIDSHAEILARRSLLLYLYKEVAKLATSDSSSSIFEAFSNGKTKLKKGLSFHLYVSSTPCGDATIFSHVVSKKPERNEQEGILRYKFEKGEACRPTVKCTSSDACLIAAQFGNKSINKMCCSDKICKWNVVGVQGGLLSNIIDPVYLKTITIGDNYNAAHCKRALCLRLAADQPNKVPMVEALPKPFRVATPTIDTISSDLFQYSIPETSRASNHCITWSVTMPTAQALSAKLGKPLDGSDASVCKKHLFNHFKHTCDVLGMPLADDRNYRDYKRAASDYQQSKAALYARLQQLAYGPWLNIYPEIEMFT